LLVGCALALAGCGGSSSSSPSSAPATTQAAAAPTGGSGKTLTGTVGPGYTITLTQGGPHISSLAPGTYTFTIADKSSIHNFTLEQESGGSFEQDLTSIPDEGTKSMTVKLTKGEWKFYCSAHESQMNGSFTVS
jgi:plastocyanin